MRRLRPTDGTRLHQRAAYYHIAKCRTGTAPLHTKLRKEMTLLHAALKDKARKVEDAEEKALDTMADVDSAETALENLIRDIDADLAKLDRSDPSLNAQSTVFPEGFGEVIDPEGDAQLTVLPGLRVRLEAFKNYPAIAQDLTALQTAEDTFRAALLAEEEAEATVDELFAAEQGARQAIREQLESAYGRLRDLYKSKPALAEPFFLNEGSASRPSKKDQPPADPPVAPNAGPDQKPA
ncbi:MAG: hypothetical protein U0359_21900 [Byssovorax sp.]